MRVKPGGEHDDIHLVQHALVGHHAPVLDVIDAAGDQFDIVPLDRPVEAGGHHQTFAHWLVIRRQCLAQIRVTDQTRLARHVTRAPGDASPV